MGAQPDACQTATAAQPNQSVNPGNGIIYNICPAGWRLPTGGANGEWKMLNDAVNGGLTNTNAGLRMNSLLMHNGVVFGNGFSGQGTLGYYWSSTVQSSTSSYAVNHDNGWVNIASAMDARSGFAVRCVAD